VELFIHGAVSRDMLEPATASFAHRKIGLPATAQIFDLSNACFGFLNALTVAAGLIESGQIRCALVVAGENGRPLVEQTLRTLVERPLTRNDIKPFFANLTIGSGAVAAVVCHRSLVTGRPHRLLGGIARAATQHSELCQGDTHGADALAMQTDSEAAAGRRRGASRRKRGGTSAETRHGVRPLHLPPGRQHAPAETLRDPRSRSREGLFHVRNARQHRLRRAAGDAVRGGRGGGGAGRHAVGLLGIGSGLNCLMLALEW
jgi:hypothetical protein